MYSLNWLANVLRAANCVVKELPGWQTCGHGDFGTPKGVLLHHTACGAAGAVHDLGILVHGRPPPDTLPGPLCNLALERDGTYYSVAGGKAWHAGFGSYQSLPLGNFGNGELIGIEMENDGVHEPWPQVQLDAARAGVKALLAHIGAPIIMCAGHKEYARKLKPPYDLGRKIDPDFDMLAFRASLEGAKI